MKLDKLWIGNFKNLQDVSINFDPEHLISVLIGWNGTGKSNLIEALVIIFRDLDLGQDPRFPYKLEYRCRNRLINIDADPERIKKNRVKITISEKTKSESELSSDLSKKSITFANFWKDSERIYLPSNVFGYYSGPSNRLEEHFEKHQRNFSKALRDGEDKPLRPLFYARQIHSNFVLLAFFIAQDEKVKTFLKEELFIEGLESVLFVMRKPFWKSSEGDPRFWNARGVVKEFLSQLYNEALAPHRVKRRVMRSDGSGRTQAMEFLYLFIKDIKTLEVLAEGYDQSDIFKLLESTYISDVIEEVRIRVRIRNLDGSLTFRELSEGEQQLLTVFGLLRFTAEKESLFLLDEPDTHLNPVWGMKYFDLLDRVIGSQKESHIIIATHDPILIASLVKEQVQIMKRNSETLRINVDIPSYDPVGMGYTGILTSDMFGLRSDLDQLTLSRLDRKVELAGKAKLKRDEVKELEEINLALEKTGFLEAYSDPYFSLFAKAWARRGKAKLYQKPFILDADREEMKELADEVMQEIEQEKIK